MRENERNFKNTVKIVSFFQVELANNPLTFQQLHIHYMFLVPGISTKILMEI